MDWEGFKNAAPELATHAERLFNESGFVFLGTIRKDGSPRISPLHMMIIDGKLYLSMMWHSLKAADLLRDPRCTIHSSIKDPMSGEAEFKLHGRAVKVEDDEQRRQLYKKIGWNPGKFKSHLFWIDIQSAGLFTTEGKNRIFKRWRMGDTVRAFRVKDIEGRLVPIT